MQTESKPTVFIADREVYLRPEQIDELRDRAHVIEPPPEWDEASLCAAADGADIIVHSFFPAISAAVMEAAGNLKATVKYGVGLDNVDMEAAARLGVMVVNCPDYGTETVADHAFALMIGLARKLIPIDRATRRTGWAWPAEEFVGVDLFGKTVGLVGFGRIGQAMGRRAAGFGMQRIACDPYVDGSVFDDAGVWRVGLEEVLERSDFVSIHCVLTDETRGLIGEAELERMKETAYLVDVSRGAVIDEAALLNALETGRIAGAGLDVFADEPLGPDCPLFALDNVIVTSHLAWYTREADKRLADECMDRIGELLDGKRPRNLRNAAALGL